MLKKIVIGLLLSSGLLFSDDLLTGDTKLSCEAILCLSTGSRPSECSPSLSRYFSINAKKWKDTIKKRKNFLKLCPVDGADEKDEVFADLRDNVLPISDPRQCTAEYLNSQVDKKRARRTNNENFYLSFYSYRINPNIPSQCNALFNHAYTDIKRPTYTCSGEFYTQVEWNMSVKLIEISYKEYQTLAQADKHQINYYNNDSDYTIFYKKVPFSKACWQK
ncbi:conjugal transfer protein TrbM [Arcobacter sp. FW59]|nr:conjugal transfer protein TrbM [Arcobacter sp. FW59]